MQLAQPAFRHVQLDPEPGRVGDGEQRRGGLRSVGEDEVGAELLADVDVLVHHHPGDGAGDVVHVVEVAARRAEQPEAGLGAFFFGEAAVEVRLRAFHVLLRRRAVLLEGLDAGERLVELRVIAQGFPVIGLRLAVIGGVHQRQVVPFLDGLSDFRDDFFDLPGHGRENAVGAVLVPGDAAGEQLAVLLDGPWLDGRQATQLRAVWRELDGPAADPGGGLVRFR